MTVYFADKVDNWLEYPDGYGVEMRPEGFVTITDHGDNDVAVLNKNMVLYIDLVDEDFEEDEDEDEVVFEGRRIG